MDNTKKETTLKDMQRTYMLARKSGNVEFRFNVHEVFGKELREYTQFLLIVPDKECTYSWIERTEYKEVIRPNGTKDLEKLPMKTTFESACAKFNVKIQNAN
jgi:hypothetical protein